METLEALKIAPPGKPSFSSEAPTPALERPQKLKSWSSDLVRIVDSESPSLFDEWSFKTSKLTRADLGRTLEKMSYCGSVVEMRSAVNRNTGEIAAPVLHAANFCGQHTICPYCAARVQDRRLAKWRAPIAWAADKFKYAYLITATTAPAATWSEGIAGLRAAWRAFYLKGQKRAGGRDAGEWSKVRAGLAKMEIKRGEDSGLPHCHYHSIVFTDERIDYRVWSREEKKKPEHAREPLYKIPWPSDSRGWIPASKLSYEWSEASGFTAVDFDVQLIKWRGDHQGEGVSYAESVFLQSIEVLKYATKFDSSPETGAEKLFAADFIGIKNATYQRRLFHTYGAFYKDKRKPDGEACPFLTGEDDFTGGGPQLYEGPLIYESRWKTRGYSQLVERPQPVFKGMERSLPNQYRRTMLNRLSGRVRRMRTAIMESRRFFFEENTLVLAAYMDIKYASDGAIIKAPAVIEFPDYVYDDPGEPAVWERWIDEITEGGARAYKSLRESLGADDEIPFEQKTEFWTRYFQSKAYDEEVTRAFEEILKAQVEPWESSFIHATETKSFHPPP